GPGIKIAAGKRAVVSFLECGGEMNGGSNVACAAFRVLAGVNGESLNFHDRLGYRKQSAFSNPGIAEIARAWARFPAGFSTARRISQSRLRRKTFPRQAVSLRIEESHVQPGRSRANGKAAGGYCSRGGRLRPVEKGRRAEFFRTVSFPPGEDSFFLCACHAPVLSLLWLRGFG